MNNKGQPARNRRSGEEQGTARQPLEQHPTSRATGKGAHRPQSDSRHSASRGNTPTPAPSTLLSPPPSPPTSSAQLASGYPTSQATAQTLNAAVSTSGAKFVRAWDRFPPAKLEAALPPIPPTAAKDELTEAKGAIKELEEQLRRQNELFQAYNEKQASAHDAALRSLKDQLKKHESEKNSLKNNLSNLGQEKRALESKTETLTRDNKTLKDDVNKLNSSKAALESTVAELSQGKTTLTTEIDKLLEVKAGLEAKVGNLEGTVESQKASIARLGGDRRDLEAQLQTALAQATQAEEDLATATKQAASDKKALHDRIDSLSKQAVLDEKTLQDKLDTLSTENTTIRAERDYLREDVSYLEGHLSAWEERNKQVIREWEGRCEALRASVGGEYARRLGELSGRVREKNQEMERSIGSS